MVLPQRKVFPLQNSLHGGIIPTTAIPHINTLRRTMSKAQSKEVAAEKHKVAERGRRKRINQQFDSLRTNLPNLNKMDKATVLGEAIRQVKELKKKVKEIKTAYCGRIEHLVPAEKDSLSLTCCENDGSLVKATFSCEDRLELISEVTRALKSVAGQAVRAEMVMVGGRVKAALLVKGFSGNGRMGMLKRALQMVVDHYTPNTNSWNDNINSLPLPG